MKNKIKWQLHSKGYKAVYQGHVLNAWPHPVAGWQWTSRKDSLSVANGTAPTLTQACAQARNSTT